MDNSYALTEIQSKYQNCNLLIPAATSVQINPFYKCTVMEVVADTSEKSGDIFKVGNTKTGEDRNGKPIYKDVFSPAKPLLMKLATAEVQYIYRQGLWCGPFAGWYVQNACGDKAHLPG